MKNWALKMLFSKSALLLILVLIVFNQAWAIPLPSETSDLVLVCRGFPHWPHYKNLDADNALIINYQTNKIYWYGDITNKQLFNELNILDEKRVDSLLFGKREIIDITLALPTEPVQRVGRIIKSARHNYITAIIGDYSFRARCIFYSSDDYNRNILPQFNSRS